MEDMTLEERNLTDILDTLVGSYVGPDMTPMLTQARQVQLNASQTENVMNLIDLLHISLHEKKKNE